MGKKSEAVKRRNRRLAFVILIALLGLLAVIFVIIGVMGMIERGRQTASSASSASQTAPSGGADSSDENADGTTVSTNGATTGPTSKPTSKPTAKTTAGSDGLLPVAKYVQKNRSVWNLILVNDYNPLPENFESTIHIRFSRAGQAVRRPDCGASQPNDQGGGCLQSDADFYVPQPGVANQAI